MRTMRAARFLLLTALVISGAANCAVLIPEHRVLTRLLDEHLAPESPVARVALAPAAVPVGLAALSIDGVLINPVRRVPDSIENANFVFDEVPYAGIGEILVFPMRVVTYPVIFFGSMLFYVMAPID
ncbi:MAG: hypothetical protein RIF32_23710 [Leptospirales bacterium]